jgi:hypothetical protein
VFFQFLVGVLIDGEVLIGSAYRRIGVPALDASALSAIGGAKRCEMLA